MRLILILGTNSPFEKILEFALGDENEEFIWPELIIPEAFEILERAIIIKTQDYTWADWSGIPGPPPTDWLKETQMGLTALAAHEGRAAKWAREKRGKYAHLGE